MYYRPPPGYPVVLSHGRFVTTIFVWRTDRQLMGQRGCSIPGDEWVISSNMFISNNYTGLTYFRRSNAFSPSGLDGQTKAKITCFFCFKWPQAKINTGTLGKVTELRSTNAICASDHVIFLAGIPGSPAAIYHSLMDAASRAIMSCPVRRCEKRV